MKVIGFIATAAVYIFVASLWYGYVLSVLWAWFIVSLFHAPSLSVPAAIGISITVGMFKSNEVDPNDKRSNTERLVVNAVNSFLAPAFALLFGYIAHLFM